jgi:hypothetical protein
MNLRERLKYCIYLDQLMVQHGHWLIRFEYSYTVANTTKYTFYRFLANKVTGGNNTGTCYSLVNFKTEGSAYSL